MKDDSRFPKLVAEPPKVTIGGRVVPLPSNYDIDTDPINALKKLRDSVHEIAELLAPKPPS